MAATSPCMEMEAAGASLSCNVWLKIACVLVSLIKLGLPSEGVGIKPGQQHSAKLRAAAHFATFRVSPISNFRFAVGSSRCDDPVGVQPTVRAIVPCLNGAVTPQRGVLTGNHFWEPV